MRLCDSLQGAFAASFNAVGDKVSSVGFNSGRLYNLKMSDFYLDRFNCQIGVNSTEFNRDGRLLVASCMDCTAKIWDPYGSSEGFPVILQGHTGPVLAACFSHSRAIPSAQSCNSSSDQCCMCLELLGCDFVVGNAANPSDPCGHRIHAVCSQRIFQCPLCRKDLNRQTP